MDGLRKARNWLGRLRRKLTGTPPKAARPVIPAGVNRDPVLIFQMGRVGSKSVLAAVEKSYRHLGLSVPLIHFHYLNNFELIEGRARQDLPDASLFVQDLYLADEVRNLLASLDGRKVKIISLVRDPLARNVSTFFFALDEFIPDWEQRLQAGALGVEELQQVFLSRRAFVLTAMNWFEEQLEPTFGIDVYASPFPMERGYQMYSSANADLLLLRMEDMNRCAGPAIAEFLGLSEVGIGKVHPGETLKAGELYRLFKTRPLPREYVEWTYSFRLARHFYSDAEREAFKQKWTGSA